MKKRETESENQIKNGSEEPLRESVSGDVFYHLAGRGKEYFGVLEHIAVGE